jgi:ring-1,2-phenylacetyl-CoA epoxidase subunit PaaC
MTNIALDYLGQARMFYQYIAELSEDGSTEDSIAYLRDTHEYRNCLLVELPNGDWAQTVLKIFFISAWQSGLYKQLRQCPDERLAAISAKSLKEVNYHLSWSADWMKRFGNGTAESNQRVNDALVYLWNYTGELFCQLPASKELVNYSSLEINWLQAIGDVFNESSLQVPNAIPFQQGGYHGRHTEYLGYILAEMQWLQRVYPGCEW